jgi:hypothetical protein
MPRFAISREVTTDQAVDALRAQLGERYRVEPRGGDRFFVTTNTLSRCTLAVEHGPGKTELVVHPFGLFVLLMINWVGITRAVSRAAQRAASELSNGPS